MESEQATHVDLIKDIVPCKFLSSTNIYRMSEHCGNNNKDEDISPKTLYNKNHQALSQKFRQLIYSHLDFFLSNYRVCWDWWYTVLVVVGLEHW